MFVSYFRYQLLERRTYIGRQFWQLRHYRCCIPFLFGHIIVVFFLVPTPSELKRLMIKLNQFLKISGIINSLCYHLFSYFSSFWCSFIGDIDHICCQLCSGLDDLTDTAPTNCMIPSIHIVSLAESVGLVLSYSSGFLLVSDLRVEHLVLFRLFYFSGKCFDFFSLVYIAILMILFHGD